MRATILAAASLLMLLLVAGPAAADDGQVTVVHGVPDLTVDVYVNGDLTLEDFAPGTVTDPLTLPEGDYEIEIYAAGTDPDAEDPAITDTVTLPAGANASVVAHLSEDGSPTLTPFVNDTSAVAAGEARLVVRHTAAAPAVDVRAAGEPVFSNLANPDEASADLPAGTVSADVVPAGGSDPVLGPADVALTEGSATIVYAIGSLDDGNLDLLVQTISGLGSAPSAVHAGTGGLVDSALPIWAVTAMAAGAVLVIGGSARLVLARVRS